MVMIMVMNDLLPPPLCNVNDPPILRYSYFKIWPWKSMVKVMWGQRSSLTFKIQRSRLWSSSNPLLTFEAWSSIDMFVFRFVAIEPLLAEISEIPYLTLKIQGQGHGQGQIRWSHLRPWSSINMFALVSWQSDHFWLRYSKFYIWPWKFKVKVMAKVKSQWSHLSPRVQSICLLLVSWQSDHFWLRYSKFYIWPWKFKVKVMAKVKPDGHIWALEFSRYVCFLFRGNRTIFGWDIANSIFDLEKSRSRSRRKCTKI